MELQTACDRDRDGWRVESRVDARHDRRKHAVARHRVIDARAGEHHRADARGDADDREDRQQRPGHGTEEPLRDDVGQALP